MKKQKNKKISSVISSTVAAAMLIVGIAPVIIGPQTVYAAGQAQQRSIEMSDSSVGAAATYAVSFNVATTGTIQGVVVDFCSNSPLIGVACTAPGGLSVGAPTVTGVSGLTAGTWTATSMNSGRTLAITNSSGASVTAGTTVTFNITSMTNPTAVGSFYARILTYQTSTAPASYTDTSPGAYVDGGGVALSINNVIALSAKVQETLSFCVYVATCGDSTSIQMGHTVGTVQVIDSAAVYTSNVDFSISTNATHGAAVRLSGDTLKSGSNSIPAIGGTAGPITAGTADFGLYLSTLGSNISATAPYTGSASTYALDTNNTTGTTSTYGEQIAALSGPVNNSISTITYGVTASNTTPAGIYTANHQLIATATF